MPQISVIVPVYKVEPYLHRCVDSILAQTFKDFELILVDDGSPDNCPAICDEYKEKDSRVIVIHQQNGGLSAARNAGIDWAFTHSDSEWLFFVDSDDWIHPMSLEALINGAKQTSLDVIIGRFERTEGHNPIVDTKQLLAKKLDTETYFCEHYANAVIACGKLYRKVSFNDIRYPFGKIHEDAFTTYKILFKYKEIAVVEQPLYAYYKNPNSITGVCWNLKRLDVVEALEEMLVFFDNRNLCMKRFTIRQMLNTLGWQVNAIDNSDKIVRKKYYRKIRRLLRGKIWKYKGMVSFADIYIAYDFAYPKLMLLYWKYKELKGRITICQK